MRAQTLLAAALALGMCVSAVRAADDPTVSLPGVQDLTPDNFDKLVNGGKAALIEFYAPWCGHCKRMTPEFKTLGEMVEGDPKLKSRVVVAKVNADEHRSLGERFDVRGFPSIKFFPRGKAPTKDSGEAYSGARTADAFAAYLRERIALDKSFGRVASLDEIAAKAGKATKAGLAAVIKELETAAGNLEADDKANGEIYVKLAKKAAEKGVEFFKTEAARLERMISSGSVAAAKLEEMSKKAGILGAFAGEGGDKKEEQ